MEDVNHSIDERRAIRQQTAALAETTTVLLTIMRPLFDQQRAMIRFWADTLEAWVVHGERIAETVSSLTQQTAQQAQQAAQHGQQQQSPSPSKR